MYTVPRKKEKEKEKVRLSFSSWILGGPIVQPANGEEHIRRRSSGNKLSLVVGPGDDTIKVRRRATIHTAAKEPEAAKPEEDKKSDDKAAEEKPADDKKADSEKVADKKEGEDGKKKDKNGGGMKEFTAEQDADIVKLHGEGKTWREIAKAVKRGQKDCQARLEELEKGGGAKGEGEANPTPAVASEGEDRKEDKKEDRKGKSKKKENKSENAKKKSEEVKEEVVVEEGGTRLKADDIWTKDDCKTLEMLEGRYREQKWLQIQASFYNYTGRMVVADLIEKKFKDG